MRFFLYLLLIPSVISSNITTILNNECKYSSASVRETSDNAWLFRSAVWVISSQSGFSLVEASYVRDDNIASIMVKNIVDMVISSVCFFFQGYSLTCSSNFIGNIPVINGFNLDDPIDFIFKFSFASTAVTISSGTIAERMTHHSYYLLGIVIIMFVYPVVSYWTSYGFLSKMGFIDFAGASSIHLLGGTVALVSAVHIGPRIGKYRDYYTSKNPLIRAVLYDRKIWPDSYYRGLFSSLEVSAIRGVPYFGLKSASNMLFGTFLLYTSWLSFNTGSLYSISDENANVVGGICIVTILTAASSMITTILIASSIQRRFTIKIEDIGNGILSGLVSSSACCGNITYNMSLLHGVIASVTYIVSSYFVEVYMIDDVVDAISSHGSVALTSLILVGVTGTNSPFNGNNCGNYKIRASGYRPILIQILGCISIVLYTGIVTKIALYLISRVLILRPHREDELIGLDLSHHDFSNETPTDRAKRIVLYGKLRDQIKKRNCEFYDNTPLSLEELTDMFIPETYKNTSNSSLFPVQASTRSFNIDREKEPRIMRKVPSIVERITDSRSMLSRVRTINTRSSVSDGLSFSFTKGTPGGSLFKRAMSFSSGSNGDGRPSSSMRSFSFTESEIFDDDVEKKARFSEC